MSVIGKGRGRGFTDVRDAPLRRPGQTNISKFSDLIDLIDDVCFKDPMFNEKVDKILQMFEHLLKSNSIKEIFEDLHKQALDDRQFGIKLNIVCCDPKIYTLTDCMLRSIILTILQKDYEERDQIKKRSIVQFRNAVSLLGGVYCNFKINGTPLKILSGPLLCYLQMLLDTSEEEDIELITVQLFVNGSKIFEKPLHGSEDFLISVRRVLVNRNLSAKSRAMLLYIIDSSHQSFKPLSGEIKEFYFKIYGDTFLEIEKFANNIIFESHNFKKCKSASGSIGDKNSLVNVTMKASQEEGKTMSSWMDKCLINKSVEKPSIPRAIRGAGTGDTAKDKHNKKLSKGKRDKINDEQIWLSKPNTSSKVWGHDDRFDKDYTQT
ncbi:uncharacterized protein LOC131662732 isoform X1 [Phymastichus coffea]|uniref:uncharacterized protein LOC131662732 isoform X1 n=1 Tax=Phymastichus coffea TaxID=108790 RepID=UPI00273A918C|nr:uncharacterized protein LOC131662732 isoform X1 [Phymastichus coffea]